MLPPTTLVLSLCYRPRKPAWSLPAMQRTRPLGQAWSPWPNSRYGAPGQSNQAAGRARDPPAGDPAEPGLSPASDAQNGNDNACLSTLQGGREVAIAVRRSPEAEITAGSAGCKVFSLCSSERKSNDVDHGGDSEGPALGDPRQERTGQWTRLQDKAECVYSLLLVVSAFNERGRENNIVKGPLPSPSRLPRVLLLV